VKLGLTLKHEYRLRVFENRVLIKIFEPKTDEVTGQWRRQHIMHNICYMYHGRFGA
jgi:hypothetical protein